MESAKAFFNATTEAQMQGNADIKRINSSQSLPLKMY